MHSYVVMLGLSALTLGLAACGDDDSSAKDTHKKREAAVDAGTKESGPDASSGREVDAASPRDGGGDILGPVQLEFKAVVGSETFACGRTYKLGTTQIAATPIDFRFFVQDLKLIRPSGEEIDAPIRLRAPDQDEGVALVDFIDGKGACVGDEMTNVEVTGNAPIGDYDGVVFTVGVPESFNHQNIVTAKPPLQNTSLYWNWLNGYRFFLAQVDASGLAAGGADNADGGAAFTSSLIHLGSEACGGSAKLGYSCERPNRNRVRLRGFDPRRRAIVVDLAAVFAKVDLRDAKQCRGSEKGCESFFEALGLSFETGQPLDMQSVFRLQ